MGGRTTACIAWLGTLGACAPARGVIVDLRTDFQYPREVATIETQVSTSSTEFRDALRILAPDLEGEDLLVSARIAEVGDPGADTVYLRVILRDPRGGLVAVRPAVVDARTRIAFTVVVTRTCTDVECPGSGPPELTACLAGRCVDPRCIEEDPIFCGTVECTDDAECERTGLAACIETGCVEGECLAWGHDELCEAPRVCDVESNGCDFDPLGLCDDGDPCTYDDVQTASGDCAGTAISCVSDACSTRVCNGAAACTVTPAAAGAACEDGNPCTVNICDGGGACIGFGNVADGTQLGQYRTRCCGGVVTDILSDANCGGCGINCHGTGCSDVGFTIGVCNCPVSDAHCRGTNGGPTWTCYDASGDAFGWLCNCQSPADCAPGQRCVERPGTNLCLY